MHKDSCYSVLIVSANEKFNATLTSFLPKDTYDPVMVAESVSAARRLYGERKTDLVIVNAPLRDENGIGFAVDVAEGSSCGVMLLVKNDYYDEISDKVQDYGVLTVARPVTTIMMTHALRMLCSTRERLVKLEKKQQTFEEKIKEIKIVNRAKLLLMENLMLSEEEAHKKIERTAMDSRKTRLEIAEKIIKEYSEPA